MLLAKSIRNGIKKTLLEHSQDVWGTFVCLFGSVDVPTDLGNSWRRFFRMDSDDWQIFHNCAAPIMLLHDFGKANSGFQNAVLGKGEQVIRHEHLSVLWLYQPNLLSWLDEITSGHSCLVLSAIVGHHLQAGRLELFGLKSQTSSFTFEPESIELFSEVNRVLSRPNDLTIEKLGIEPIWNCTSEAFDFSRRIKPILDQLRRIQRKANKTDQVSEMYRQTLMALRAALVICDSAASGLTREKRPMLNWLNDAFNPAKRIDGGYIYNHIIEPRQKQIVEKFGKFEWQDFQLAAGDLPERSLLLASCGAGKTLAAWRWIQQQVQIRSVGRVLFLYPTRATATEGFRDYISWAPEADASLLTGTAAWELADQLFENPNDGRRKKDFTTEDRLFAIGYWHRRIFSATVDQFLGFMQNSYASICLLPMIADSVVVVDEVHSFDKSLFSAFKLFLKNFDVPVLAMTASLPERRRRDLESLGMRAFPQDLSQFRNLERLSKLPRYKVHRLVNELSAEQIVRENQDANKVEKILWVVNTIGRCQELAKRFSGPNTLCYHSGFKLGDRKARHQELVKRFQNESGPLLAITTQVCEMSLDLDADILISEMAPITSIIQRMGRCNRHARDHDSKLGQVFIYPPPNKLPYGDKCMEETTNFVDAIHNRAIDQNSLQQLLEQQSSDVEVEKYSGFIECGPFAVAHEESLRDINETTVQAILSSDVDVFLQMRKERTPTDGLIVPAPLAVADTDSRLGQYPQVVDSALYSAEVGLERRKDACVK